MISATDHHNGATTRTTEIVVQNVKELLRCYFRSQNVFQQGKFRLAKCVDRIERPLVLEWQACNNEDIRVHLCANFCQIKLRRPLACLKLRPLISEDALVKMLIYPGTGIRDTENDFTEKFLTSPRLERALPGPMIYSIDFLSGIFKNNNPFMESVLVKLDLSSDHSFRLQVLPVLSPVVGQIPGAGPPLKAALDSLLENLKAADVSSL